jgi:hypothetical protein
MTNEKYKWEGSNAQMILAFITALFFIFLIQFLFSLYTGV